jgi:hypothetical protein
MTADCELTILMPCLNEAETLATCIRKARDFLASAGVGQVMKCLLVHFPGPNHQHALVIEPL